MAIIRAVPANLGISFQRRQRFPVANGLGSFRKWISDRKCEDGCLPQFQRPKRSQRLLDVRQRTDAIHRAASWPGGPAKQSARAGLLRLRRGSRKALEVDRGAEPSISLGSFQRDE